MNQKIPEVINGRNCYMGSDGPVLALIAFYAAFNDRDLAALERNWWTEGEMAVMANPLGGLRRGWRAIRDVYEWVFRGEATVYVEFYDYALYEVGDLFYAVGRERGYLDRAGQRLELAIRTSRVFRKHNGRWRQVHHHGSIEDPTLLERYQQAVSNVTAVARKAQAI
ncbi:MAG: YybH family protein [Sulfuricaulis sp.]